MFAISAFSSDRTDYVPENVTVQTCTKQDDKYEFGFNGQMKVNEVAGVGNWLNFDERMFNTRIARFPTSDPLMKKFPEQSPYIFAGNNPVMNIDKKGAYKVAASNQESYNKSYPLIMKYISTMIESDIANSTRVINGLIKTNPNIQESSIKGIAK